MYKGVPVKNMRTFDRKEIDGKPVLYIEGGSLQTERGAFVERVHHSIWSGDFPADCAVEAGRLKKILQGIPSETIVFNTAPPTEKDGQKIPKPVMVRDPNDKNYIAVVMPFGPQGG